MKDLQTWGDSEKLCELSNSEYKCLDIEFQQEQVALLTEIAGTFDNISTRLEDIDRSLDDIYRVLFERT